MFCYISKAISGTDEIDESRSVVISKVMKIMSSNNHIVWEFCPYFLLSLRQFF